MAITLEEINENVKGIDEKVDQLLTWKLVHGTEHKTISRDVNEVRDVLFANPGIVNRVERLWNCKASISEWRSFLIYILKAVLTAGIIGVLAWLLLLFKEIQL